MASRISWNALGEAIIVQDREVESLAEAELKRSVVVLKSVKKPTSLSRFSCQKWVTAKTAAIYSLAQHSFWQWPRNPNKLDWVLKKLEGWGDVGEREKIRIANKIVAE